MAKRPKHTQRSLSHFKALGYRCGPETVVESYNAYTGLRHDLLGIIDFLAIRPGEIVGVQSFGQDFAEHKRKVLGSHLDRTILWLSGGGLLCLIGWRKVKKKRGGKQMVWAPRIEWIRPAHIDMLEVLR